MVATRFDAWRPAPARALLAVLALLCLSGAFLQSRPPTPEDLHALSSNPQRTDRALYTAIAARIGAGESYYDAAIGEQRGRGYPLRPFVTVRPPLLAEVLGRLGLPASEMLLSLVMAAVLVAMVHRLRTATQAGLRSRAVQAAALLAGLGAGLCAIPALTVWHEAWAALLIALSLACRSERHWAASVAIGLLAALVRELALPYLFVMLVLSFAEGRHREATAWAGSALVFAGALAWHAATVMARSTAADIASPGWVAIGGWGRALGMVQDTTLFTVLPAPLTGVLVPLALLGWAAWRHPTGIRGAALLAGYLLAFSLLGRADNRYWGLMLAPLLPLGLAFCPLAMRDLWIAARRLPGPALQAA